MTWRQQQRALFQVEVQIERGFGVGGEGGKGSVQAREYSVRLCLVTGQLHSQVAVVCERAQDNALGLGSLHTPLEHRLQSKVRAKRPEWAAHAHTFCARDGLDHAVDGEEAGAVHGVEEVRERDQVWAALSHGVEHGLERDSVEAVAEVELEDGEALPL
jgi:hypothetical protein